MLRTILVGLDGSDHSKSAVELGIVWAKRFDALLVGLGVIDQADICAPEAVPLGAGAFKGMIDETRLHEAQVTITNAIEAFSLRCAEEGVSSKPLEDVGRPAERIALEAQRYDLIMMGRQTFFHLDADPGETLRSLLNNTPRPIVIVPQQWREGDGALIAYDGSLQATHALSAFAASGLASRTPVHVLSIHEDKIEAARVAQRAVEYLGFHDIQAQPHAIAATSSPADLVLEHVNSLKVGLLVMGCYGQSTLREFFLGSVTQALLDNSPIPLFLYH